MPDGSRILIPLLMVVALLSAACSDSAGPEQGAARDPTDCPNGFDEDAPEAGTHEGFASAGQDRSFHLLLPNGDASEPVPLFVSLTGTVQEEVAFMEQSGIDRLPDDGWMVVAPVRNGNGVIWEPWDALRTPEQTQPNPDATFIVELIECLAARHPIDRDRIFVGGISIGGTMVNYLLQRHSYLFAGGIVGSGNFILTSPGDPIPLDDMVVVVTWGGDTDVWTGCPDGRMGAEFGDEPGCVTVEFVADASLASQYYDAQPAVRQVACTEDAGHIWITHATPYWAELLASHPKGSSGPVELGLTPAPLDCSTDAFIREGGA